MTTKISTANIQASTLATLGANPKISSVIICDSSYVELDDTAIELSGGYIKIRGSGFKTGATVTINKTLATSVTFISSTEIRAQVGAQVAGTYVIYVINPDGSVAIRVNGITYSATPAWVTGSSLTGVAEEGISVQLSAPPATAYALQSGSTLPTGLTLSSSGLISGTITGLSVETIYNFTVVATDAELQDSPRTFSITVTVGDPYIKYTTTLLSAKPLVGSFNKDSSTNNLPITIVGDTRPNSFNPYTPGYYSAYFDAKTDYISIPATTALTTFTGDFTFEAWVYPSDTTITYWGLWDSRQSGATAQAMVLSIDPLASAVAGQGRMKYYNGTSYYSTSIVNYNQWTHVAWVRSGSTMTFYVNGVAGGTATISGTQTGTATTNPVYIGTKDNASASYGTTGYISNFRVVNGTAVYTSNFTPSTTPLPVITNTVLLTAQDNSFIDNSSNNYTLTSSSAAISGFDPYTPNSSYSTYGSTYFDGTGDYLSVPYSGAFSTGSTFTIEAYVYPTVLNATNNEIFNITNTTTTNFGGLMVYVNGSGVAYFESRPGNGGVNVSISGGSVPVNKWTHMAVSVSSNTAKLFVNGVQVASGTIEALNGTQNYVAIGAFTNGFTAYPWTGYISNLRVVKGTAVYTSNFMPPTAPLTAITNTQLLTCQSNQPANNNVFIDNSSNNILIARNGNTTQGTFSPYGGNWSNYFDGTGDYLQTTSSALSLGTGDFTVECWFNVNITSNNGLLHLAASYFPASVSGIALYVSSNNISMYCANTASAPGGTITPGTWYHVAMVRSSGVTKLYLNGVYSTAIGAVADTTNYTGTALVIGGYYNNTLLTNGYISNLRIVKGTALYTSNFTPSTTPLQAVADSNLLTCQSPNLVDNSASNLAITKNGDVSVQKFGPFAGTTLPTPYYSAYFNYSDYITVADSAAIQLGTGDFTIEFWAYKTAAQTTYGIFNKGSEYGLDNDTSRFVYRIGGGNGFVINGTVDLNVWTHIALVKSGTTTTLYKNGTSLGTSTSVITNSTNALNIGYCSTGALAKFPGYISNFRIVKGTAVYTANFTPPTNPLTAISGTSLLTCQADKFIDASANNLTISSSGAGTKPTTFSLFTPTYLSKQSYTPDVFGGSMYFDGNGDYLSSTNPGTVYQFGTSNWTIEGWFYSTNTSTTQTIFQIYGNTNDNINIQFNGSTLAPFVSFRATNQTILTITSTVLAKLNTWNHIVVTRDSSTTVKVYVNGVLGANQAIASTTTFVDTQFTGNPTIGAKTNTVGEYFYGYISDLRVVKGTAVYASNFVPQNKPLTAIKNTALLLNGTDAGIYDSVGMNDYETVGDVKISNFSPHNGNYYSNYFDGNGDYLSTTSQAFGTSDFTIEAWVNCNTVSTIAQTIFDCRLTNSSSAGFWFGLYYNGTVISPGVYTNGAFALNTSVNCLNTWVHTALVRNGSTFTIYINGVNSGTFTSNASFTDTNALIGSSATVTTSSTNYLLGNISNLRVVKGTAVYTSAFTPPTAPLTAITNTSLLTCQSNRFIDNSANKSIITKNGDTKVDTLNPFQANSGTSMYFDGSGDNLLVPYTVSHHLPKDFTIEFWMNWQDGTVGGMLLNKGGGSGIAYASYEIYTDTVTRNIRFAASTANTSYDIGGESSAGNMGAVNIGEWAHIAVTRSGNTFRGFVNGVLGFTQTSSADLYDTSPRGLAIGSNYSTTWGTGTPTSSFKGYISDLRITKGVARYTSTFTPPTAPVITK